MRPPVSARVDSRVDLSEARRAPLNLDADSRGDMVDVRMSSDLDALRDSLRAGFPDHELVQDESEEKTSFTLRKGWNSGVDVTVEAGVATVEWETKIGTALLFGMIGIVIALMIAFAEPMLRAMELIVDTGTVSFTLKLLYIIPLLIFLTPMSIVYVVLGKRLAPPNDQLVARASDLVTTAGFTVKVDEE